MQKSADPRQLSLADDLRPWLSTSVINARVARRLRWWRYRANLGLWWEWVDLERREVEPEDVRSDLLN